MANPTITQKEILEELEKAYYKDKINDNEITTKMWADYHVCSQKTARNQLDKRVREGKMSRREALINGRIIIAYSIIK